MPPALQNPFLLWFLLSVALAVLCYFAIRRELRLRATLYGSFLLACLVAIWPPYGTDEQPGKINLGLDLKGGIHLVLQVVTDDALNATIDDAVGTGRAQMTAKGIKFASAQRVDATSFSIDGVEPARVKDVRDLLRDYFRSRTAGTCASPAKGRFVVKMTDPFVSQVRDRTVKEAIKTLERRVNQLGVAEPVIAQHGAEGDQILVQLPGVKDVEQAKRVIKTTAQLALKMVEDEAGTREALLEKTGGKVPDNMDVVQGPGRGGRASPSSTSCARRRSSPAATSRTRAPGSARTTSPTCSSRSTRRGRTSSSARPGRNVGRRLAIVLDGSVASAPTIQSQIGAEGQITGRFTAQEADELAKVLRAGALPATLRYLQELTVGASLGRDSIRQGVMAAAMGMGFLAIFMIVYYRLSGVNAIVALAANLLILLGCMAYSGATLTLPGIAGIILTVGVGVDTNVLVFERIREELRNGKTVRAAINNGFDRVWITILDTHATALIAAAFLFQFGTGPVKGFAVTLVMGLIANIFASYFVSRFIFEWVLGKRQAATLSI